MWCRSQLRRLRFHLPPLAGRQGGAGRREGGGGETGSGRRGGRQEKRYLDDEVKPFGQFLVNFTPAKRASQWVIRSAGSLLPSPNCLILPSRSAHTHAHAHTHPKTRTGPTGSGEKKKKKKVLNHHLQLAVPLLPPSGQPRRAGGGGRGGGEATQMGSFSAPARRGRRRSAGEAQPLTCGAGRRGGTQAARTRAEGPGRAEAPHAVQLWGPPPLGPEIPRVAAPCSDRAARRRRGERRARQPASQAEKFEPGTKRGRALRVCVCRLQLRAEAFGFENPAVTFRGPAVPSTADSQRSHKLYSWQTSFSSSYPPPPPPAPPPLSPSSSSSSSSRLNAPGEGKSKRKRRK